MHSVQLPLLLLLAPLALAAPRPQESANGGDAPGRAAPITAQAHVVGFPASRNITADFTFSYQQGVGTEVSYIVRSGLNNATAQYGYHVHTNPVASDGNCTSTLGHLDPLVLTDFVACAADKPELCQEGDLSAKWGKIRGTESGAVARETFTDPRLRAYPQDLSFLGRSITFHLPNGTRIACGNITSAFDGTADDEGNPTNRSSTYVTLYPSKAAAPRPTITPFGVSGSVNSTALALATLQRPLIDVVSAEYVNLVTTSVDTTIAGQHTTIGQIVAIPSSGSYTGGSALPSASQITASVPAAPSSAGQSGGPAPSGSQAPGGNGAGAQLSVAAWSVAAIVMGSGLLMVA